MNTLRKRLYSTSGRIGTTVVIARWIMLDMGRAEALVYRREENAIHPQPKVFIPELTTRLLFSI
jgi:hypothetical protein